jgi:hypothetical protein
MSAPKTNIDRQKRQHAGPLIGMALVALFGLGLVVYWQFEEAAKGDGPGAEQSGQLDQSPRDATEVVPSGNAGLEAGAPADAVPGTGTDLKAGKPTAPPAPAP